jgi:hypothetical protein
VPLIADSTLSQNGDINSVAPLWCMIDRIINFRIYLPICFGVICVWHAVDVWIVRGGGGLLKAVFWRRCNCALSTCLFTSNSYDYASEEIYNLVL